MVHKEADSWSVLFTKQENLQEDGKINVQKSQKEWNTLRKRKIKSNDQFSYNLLKYEASRIWEECYSAYT